jgi:CHAT domain-containing protein
VKRQRFVAQVVRNQVIRFCILLLAVSGAPKYPLSSSPVLPRGVSNYPQISALRARAAALFQTGQYEEAAEVFTQSYRQAREQGLAEVAAKSLNSAGAARLARFDYTAARLALLEARELAHGLADWDLATAVSVNLASLHLQVGNLEGGRREARQALADLERSPTHRYRAEVLALAAKIEAADRGIDVARPLFAAALEAADGDGNAALRARIYGQLGMEYLNRRRLAEAEAATVEAFRLRRLGGDREVAQSYRELGLVRLAQGNLDAAERMLGLAVAQGRRTPGRVPLWATYYPRGRLYAARGEPGRALEEFRSALADARRWRVRIPPSEAAGTGAETGLETLCGAFIETAADRYAATRRQALLSEAFEAFEDCRAAGLPARLGDPWRAAWRPGELLQRVRQSLDSSTVLFSFRLGEPRSYGWAVTRERVELYPLAGRARLIALAQRFRQAVTAASSESGPAGEALYEALFGARRWAAAKSRWLIAAVPELTGVPLAALAGHGQGYLIERHTVALVALAPLSSVEDIARPQPGARFVGVGDAIYNAADPRFQGEAQSGAGALPRLAGSGGEVRACAGAWRGPALVLQGRSASAERVKEAVEGGAAVVHFATHVVRAPEPPERAALALSLAARGGPELLDAEQIGSWRVAGPTVVTLSGCASGTPERRPRSYALSLAPGAVEDDGRRQAALAGAWLAAGAGAVAVSLWPTPDDTGELFVTYYRGLAAGQDAAAALGAAQREALRAGGWRSSPAYWAAYYVVGGGRLWE